MDHLDLYVQSFRLPDAQQPHVCNGEEFQQPWNLLKSFSPDQDELEPPKVKEEPQDLSSSHGGGQLVLKQETDTMVHCKSECEEMIQTVIIQHEGELHEDFYSSIQSI